VGAKKSPSKRKSHGGGSEGSKNSPGLRAPRETEARFESILALSGEWYWEQDENLRFTQFFGRTPAKAGVDARSLIGKTRWELPGVQIDPADRAALEAKTEAHQPFFDHEYRRVGPDGAVRYFRSSGHPLFDADGRFRGYRGIAKDVTQARREEQLLALEHQVSRCLGEAEDVSTALRTVIHIICESEGWECGQYWRRDEGGMLRFGEYWCPPKSKYERFIEKSRDVVFEPGVGLIGAVLQSGEPLWVADVAKDPRLLRSALVREIGSHGAFVFPPVNLEGKIIGVLAFSSTRIREPDERLLQAVRVIAAQIGQFLERKRAEEARRHAERLQSLQYSVTHSIAESESAAAAIVTVIRTVCETERWECGRYFRWDDQAGLLRFGESWGVPELAIQQFLERAKEIVYRPGDGLIGRVWQSGQPLWVADVNEDSRAQRQAFAQGLGIRGGFVFPITAEGKTIGVLAFNSREARQPDERLLEAIRAVGSQIGQFLQRKSLEEDQRRFRAALDASADMVVLIDRKTMRFVDVNETACQLLGYARDELLRMGPQDVLPASREDLERAYDEFIADPSHVVGMNSYYRRKDGSTFPFESTRRVLRSGDSYIIAAISRDIGARIEAEEALRASEARFRSLTQLSSDLYWEQDEDFRFTSFAGTGSDRVNASRRLPYIGKKRWEQNYVNMTQEDWAAHIATLEAHKPFLDLELCRLDEQGDKTWVSISGEPVFDSRGTFKGYRGVGKDITARKATEERIQYLANHDALTALPNRTRFNHTLGLALQSAQRHLRGFAVLFIDLDRFKVINDTLGHEAGDLVLKVMGSRLIDTVRSSDVVARLGGDEFVVLLQDVSETRLIETVARKILSALVKPIYIGDRECRVSASIGVCVYPSDAHDEQTLMKNADIAMYRAKEDGKNTYKFYSEDTNVHSFERLALETSLRNGLERNEFLLHFQPKLNLRTGRITGVEALVRWQHPELGLVPPGQFIPLAEETGLIVPLGKWVLRTACAQNVLWQREGLPPVVMAVNISARQFADENLLSDVESALKDSGLKPGLLELEITETMVMQNAERAAQLLASIERAGVRLAIDDFGVGQSSLTQLKRFPIDTLKVDRSFIRDIPGDSDDKAITEAIIAMGRSLNLTVVAEGVETEEQVAFLRERACDEMQGYYFSKPVPAGQLADLMRRHLQTA
jgi:diguanylate cyclase (GGDEF)-like protein/PAS domain S-box-containing protein